MGSCNSEVVHDVVPYLRVYKDGTVERLVATEVAPAGLDPKTGVLSKDVVAIPETGVVVRLYHRANADAYKAVVPAKLPLVIYFHGGAFCISSSFDPLYHASLNQLVAEADVIAASVNFRNAPEHPLPAAYEDSLAAVRWLGSHSSGEGAEEWLTQNVDFNKVFLAGDSAGANISHHLCTLQGRQLGVNVTGIVMMHPYFWGEDPIGVEINDPVRKAMVDKWWTFLCPSEKGCDDPLINPFSEGGDEKLSGLACGRILIFGAGNDILVERGRLYYETLVKSGWKGKAERDETPGEDHDFQIFFPDSDNTSRLIRRCASFINQA